MMYAQIVSMQGEEGYAAIDVAEANGLDALVEHLAQWDDGEYHDVREASTARDAWGEVRESGDYIVAWNRYFGSVSLERVVGDDYSPHQ